MAGVSQFQKQYADYKASLFHEGVLDEQFDQLQQLQDESNPNFVVEVVSLFFKDSERLLNDLTKTLSQQGVDFKKVGANVHQLKGSSSSIGAQRVQRVCIAFRNYGEEHNIEGCLKTLQLVKHEYAIVKIKLETLFKLEQQILAAGGIVPCNEVEELIQ
ncbi:histidine-containing phosphotransfer protein 1-like [Argentina anserina]|uniref:histidine-containing phosphotransfer protein 1-like n=1 Tax=Argentina anserina TaxID=57926 RepID=UPI00217628B2|nr:histidine-containing phosphotransfer protein 1-like [Potentilla anserina]